MEDHTLKNTLQIARKTRRISQLELALRIGVSQRHVSFVESGRAQPSRELLLSWLHELQAPLAVRNVALQQAGFAPVYRGSELSDTVLAPVREALARLLESHNPMPAMVLDSAWNVVMMNQGARWFCLELMPWLANVAATNTDQPMNFLEALLHPDGITQRITNLEEVAPTLLAHLRDDASVVPELLPRVELLAAQFQSRLRHGKRAPNFNALPRQMAPVLTTRFSTSHGELAFFSMFSTFGTPQDITLASLRVEHFFAADAHTQKVVQEALQSSDNAPT